jgi:hypothetical protein
MPDELHDPDELGGEEHELGELLASSRPVPDAGFRGALARWLADHDPGWGPRPTRLRLLIAAYGGGGLLLIAVGALLGLGAS